MEEAGTQCCGRRPEPELVLVLAAAAVVLVVVEVVTVVEVVFKASLEELKSNVELY